MTLLNEPDCKLNAALQALEPIQRVAALVSASLSMERDALGAATGLVTVAHIIGAHLNDTERLELARWMVKSTQRLIGENHDGSHDRRAA